MPTYKSWRIQKTEWAKIAQNIVALWRNVIVKTNKQVLIIKNLQKIGSGKNLERIGSEITLCQDFICNRSIILPQMSSTCKMVHQSPCQPTSRLRWLR